MPEQRSAAAKALDKKNKGAINVSICIPLNQPSVIWIENRLTKNSGEIKYVIPIDIYKTPVNRTTICKIFVVIDLISFCALQLVW